MTVNGNGNGWAKKVTMWIPLIAAALFVIKTAYTVGQETQANADRLDALDKKVCLVEGALRISDLTCR